MIVGEQATSGLGEALIAGRRRTYAGRHGPASPNRSNSHSDDVPAAVVADRRQTTRRASSPTAAERVVATARARARRGRRHGQRIVTRGRRRRLGRRRAGGGGRRQVRGVDHGSRLRAPARRRAAASASPSSNRRASSSGFSSSARSSTARGLVVAAGGGQKGADADQVSPHQRRDRTADAPYALGRAQPRRQPRRRDLPSPGSSWRRHRGRGRRRGVLLASAMIARRHRVPGEDRRRTSAASGHDVSHRARLPGERGAALAACIITVLVAEGEVAAVARRNSAIACHSRLSARGGSASSSVMIPRSSPDSLGEH